MAAEFDLIIRSGTVVDGTGRTPIEADVGIKGDRVAAIGTLAKSGAEEIDAKGKLVTPGFVDIHTHYDGQAVWDSHMTPSSMAVERHQKSVPSSWKTVPGAARNVRK